MKLPNNYNLFLTISNKVILLYSFSLLIFALFYNHYIPSINHIFLQLFTLTIFAYLNVYSLRQRVSLQRYFIVLFYCIFIEIVCFRIWNIVVYDNPLGYNPIDSIGYDEFARKFSNGNYAIGDVFDYIRKSGESIDDYGFNSIICITYKLFGVDVGIYVLTLLNAIAWLIGCVIIYRLSGILTIQSEGQRYTSLLWGSFSYCIYTAATGLKENFFCCIVIFTMYRLYRYLKHRNLSNFLLFSFGSICCSLFRLALFFIFMATFIFVVALKLKIFNRHLRFWIITGIILSLLLLNGIIEYISGLRGNMALNQGYADAITSGSNFFIYTGINILSAFTGSIPNFIADIEKQNYITIWNFGSFLRFLLSGYSFYAIYYIIKNRIKLFYPLLLFIVLHSVMLIVTMFAIHDRYQMVQLSFVYILSVYGMIKLQYAKKCTKSFYNKIYLLGATFFIILFNIFKFNG